VANYPGTRYSTLEILVKFKQSSANTKTAKNKGPLVFHCLGHFHALFGVKMYKIHRYPQEISADYKSLPTDSWNCKQLTLG